MEEIQARFIIEIMGRPKEHLLESMNSLLEDMKKEKEVKIIKTDTKETVPVKDASDLFVTFSEIEAQFGSVEALLGCVFKYMPAHLEIISPEQIRVKNSELNGIIGSLIERLHNYEGLTRKLIEDQHNFIRKLESMGINLFGDKNLGHKKIQEESESDDAESRN